MKLRKDRVLVSRLGLSHPLLRLLNIHPNEFYKKDFVHFGKHYDYPVVFVKHGDYTVISNIEEVLVAMNAGLNEIDVLIAEDFNEDELPRYINHRAFYKYKNSNTVKYDFISFLEHHLSNNEYGKLWALEIPGDMKKKLATILGISETQVQNIKQIGNIDRRLLSDIDDGKTTLVDALSQVKKGNSVKKNFQASNQKIEAIPGEDGDNVQPPSTSVMSPINILDNFKVSKVKIYNDRNDEIAFSYSSDKSEVLINGDPLSNYSVQIDDTIGEQTFANTSETEKKLLRLALNLKVDSKVQLPDKTERSILTPEVSKHNLLHV